uniref:Apoptotic protease activating factor 1 n=1 Tax=Echinococcus granulosus TaxID=6210 RepID=A0A068WR32_ECHGR|nr:apoptotic protease activating factor 1 [Echinococcus granulosus]
MDENKLSALKRCYPTFVQSLNTAEIIDHLIGGEHISRDEYERISAKITTMDKARTFLEFLFGKSNEAFKCFQDALLQEQPFLAKTLEEQLEKVSFSKNRQLSLTDIHQTLLRGAVPDRPTAYINRPQTIAKLTDGFRWLGGKFRPISLLVRQDGSLDNDAASHSDIPTNAWFLVYGPPGQGKSVMTAAVLRQNRQLLTDTFSGGVVWLRVGEKRGVEQTQQVIDVLSALIEHVASLPSQGRCIRQGSEDKREEPYRGCEGDVSKMTSLLHKLLIARQYRRSEVLDTHSVSPASLLLIVLDDVWDDCVVSALGTLPAAFVVTSRDMNILQRVLTPVKMESVEADMDDGEVASLIATRASISRDCLANAGGVYAELPALCRGSPLAASLLGGLLASPTFELARYLGPRGFRSATNDVIIDWSKVNFPSWYTYESLDEAVSASLNRLPKVELERYRQFVIFEDNCSLTEDVYEIYWSCTKEEAVDTLQRLHRFSLVQCRRDDGSGRNFFSVPNLQLDLLRTTVPTRRQQICHCQFVDNYKARFGGQWNQLADFKLIHTYFCRSVGEHMLKAGRLNGLIDLLTDLQFICARLLVLGSSAVLADFRRYRPVFQRVGRITDWHMYLHFLQTTAYQLINPDRLVRELHRRARSPTRPGSLCDVGGGGGGGSNGGEGRHSAMQSMTPDALGMGSGGAGGGCGGSCGSHYHFCHHSSPSPPTFRRNDTGERQRCIARLPHKDLMVKGLDLLQLGLMFPRDNAVFQQSLNILKAVDAAACKASVPPPPKYYWYWSNSNSADSELVWATRTGKDRITAIAHEVDYSSLPPSLRRRAKPSGDRSINRRFLGTSDGRIIILDVTSGYEVAVHQVHRPSVAVMAISLLPGNQSCLSCGADGRMIVSNLPPLDAFLKSPSVGGSFNRSSMVSDMGVTDLDESYFTTIDVDDDGEVNDDAFFDVSAEMGNPSSLSPPSSLAPPMLADVGVPDDRGVAPRSSSPVLQEDEFPIYTVAPTVLANLPSSFEIRRNTQVASSLPSRQTVDSNTPDDETVVQQCIALSPLGTCLLFSDSPGSSSPTTAAAVNEMTLKRRQMHENFLQVPLSLADQKPISLTIYSILAQSQAKFTLVKSRELLLPAQRGERPTQVTVATASISFDDSLLIASLSNGRLWIFSLDEIGWVACIASSIPLKANPLYSALMSARTPRPERSPLDTNTSYCDPKLVDFALTDGKVAKVCIFIHWPNQTRAPINPGGWIPPDNPLVAASIDNLVLVWAFENKLPGSVEDLQNPETIVTASRAQFCLPCPPSTTITTLDSQPFGNFCLIAAGLTSGRAVIWSLPERCKIFDVCAHGTSVTSVRLSPYGFCRSPAATPTTSPAGTSHTFDLVAVTTAAEDGVVKAWEFHWPSPKEPQSTNMSPILSGECSPSRQRRGWLEQSVNVEAFVREQPFPLWADVYSVVFGVRGEFYAIGRIKASCSLQLLFRSAQATGLGIEGDCQSFHCVELSLTCHRRRPVQNQLLPPVVATGSGEQAAAATAVTTTSAFQAVNRIVKHSPVPSCAAFSNDMRLLVVGFENGTVQVLQMNCPKDPLRGFKPYRNFSVSSRNSLSEAGGGDCGRGNSRPRVASRDLPLDIVSTAVKITHLSLWTPPVDFEEPELELVVAVATAGGTVHVWEVMHAIAPEGEERDRIAHAKVVPMKQWIRMHLPVSTSAVPSISTPTFSPLPFVEAEATNQPVVWFRFFANLELLQKCTEWRARLAWLSAGRDGLVCGRSLADDQWALDLVAHKSAEITDADVDPDGRWIAIAATDGTVCVWCLCTERKVFEGSHKPLTVRCVKFRPVATTTEMGTEVLLASGDAAGNLRVWRLTTPKGGDRSVIAARSAISSNAAGCGGSGFVCLAWSADGGTLAGLSDRLCSWRLITRANTSGAVGGGFHQVLDRSRVVRVFDTTDRRNRLFVSCASPGSPYLPSTFIVLEVHSGICFVFDPIEMIAPSTSNTVGDGGSVAAAGVSPPAATSATAPVSAIVSDVTSMLNKPY